jgi:hypothetical protein
MLARLVQVGELFVEVSESGFERLAMVGVSGGFEVMRNASSGELQVLAFLFAAKLFRAFGIIAVVPRGFLAGFNLRFHVLAFPSSRHTLILTHFAAGAWC